MYDTKTKCCCCGELKICREMIVEDAGVQYLYFICKDCDDEIDRTLEYFSVERGV